MLFCDDCADKNNWPKSGFKSRGPCECCDEIAACNDVPSRDLPLSPRQLLECALPYVRRSQSIGDPGAKEIADSIDEHLAQGAG